MTDLIFASPFRSLFHKSAKALKGQPVFITGCDSGFGRELAVRLAKRGLKVYAACLTENGVNSIRKEVSWRTPVVSRRHALTLDVTAYRLFAMHSIRASSACSWMSRSRRTCRRSPTRWPRTTRRACMPWSTTQVRRLPPSVGPSCPTTLTDDLCNAKFPVLLSSIGVSRSGMIDWMSVDDYRFCMEVNYFAIISV